MNVEPVVLEGQFVRLEPLRDEHFDALCEAGLDEELWLWTMNVCHVPEDMRRYLGDALDDHERGTALPFATVDRRSGTVVGSTRFGNIDRRNRGTEIGWTWINPRWQRTYMNTEAKLLMLMHAFEVWRCIRVEFKTDALNERSRNAIERLGAKQEGIFRNHMITDTGRYRDTVYFSIIEVEWPETKARLTERLKRA